MQYPTIRGKLGADAGSAISVPKSADTGTELDVPELAVSG
jgi:hypothetical protein